MKNAKIVLLVLSAFILVSLCACAENDSTAAPPFSFHGASRNDTFEQVVKNCSENNVVRLITDTEFAGIHAELIYLFGLNPDVSEDYFLSSVAYRMISGKRENADVFADVRDELSALYGEPLSIGYRSVDGMSYDTPDGLEGAELGFAGGLWKFGEPEVRVTCSFINDYVFFGYVPTPSDEKYELVNGLCYGFTVEEALQVHEPEHLGVLAASSFGEIPAEVAYSFTRNDSGEYTLSGGRYRLTKVPENEGANVLEVFKGAYESLCTLYGEETAISYLDKNDAPVESMEAVRENGGQIRSTWVVENQGMTVMLHCSQDEIVTVLYTPLDE